MIGVPKAYQEILEDLLLSHLSSADLWMLRAVVNTLQI